MKRAWPSLLLFLAALALSLHRLDKTLDLDEMATAAWAMAKTPADVMRLLYYPIEGNAAGYPLFIWAWGKLALSEAWLRLPSAIAVALTVVAFYRRNARRFAPEAALWAAMLLALATLPLHESQNARGYAFFALFTYLALDYWERRRAVAFALASWAALSLHHFAFLFLAPLWAIAFTRVARRKCPPSELVPILASWALYLPEVPLLVHQLQGGPSWLPELTTRVFASTTLNFAWMNGTAATALLLIPLCAGLVCGWRALRYELAWALFPIFAAAAFSLAVKPLFVERYLFPATLAVFGVVAGGWDAYFRGAKAPARISVGRILATACVLCAAWALPSFYKDGKTPDWRGAADFIKANDCAKLIVTDPYWVERWPFYLPGYRIRHWNEGYPTEPFWLAGAGFPPLPSSERALGEKLADLKFAGADTLVYCIHPDR